MGFNVFTKEDLPNGMLGESVKITDHTGFKRTPNSGKFLHPLPSSFREMHFFLEDLC